MAVGIDMEHPNLLKDNRQTYPSGYCAQGAVRHTGLVKEAGSIDRQIQSLIVGDNRY